MKYTRAKEILEASSDIPVFYDGESIWIENVDPKTSTALITTFDEEITVPIKTLYEQ